MLTSTVENILNRGLPRSPRARELCTELAGRRVAVEVRGVAEFTLESDGHGLKVTRGVTAGAEARISGGLMTLASLATATPGAPLRRQGADPVGLASEQPAPGMSGAREAGLTVEGNVDLAERFHELLRLLRPDFEEELALAIGDVPAHQLARFAKTAAAWWRGAAETTVRNFAEYFAHERGDLVSRAEGRQLLDGIDETRDRIDRIEARLSQLEQRLRAAPRPRADQPERGEP